MSGNVWEWTEDCWNANHNGASGDGSARMSGECVRRVEQQRALFAFCSSRQRPRQLRIPPRWFARRQNVLVFDLRFFTFFAPQARRFF